MLRTPNLPSTPLRHDSVGIIATTLIGIAGAILGGFVSELLGFGGLGTFFELRTWIIAVAGAVAFLAIFRPASGSPRHPCPTNTR